MGYQRRVHGDSSLESQVELTEVKKTFITWPIKPQSSESPNSENLPKICSPVNSSISAQSASKLGKINVVRKDIAKVLTVINQTRKAELQKLYRGKAVKPVDLKPRKTRALRKRLSKHESGLKSLKTIRREQKTALKNFALKA